MAKTFEQLNKEIEALKARAEAVRQREKAGVAAQARRAILVYGLTAEELGLSGTATATTPRLAAVKKTGKRASTLDRSPLTVKSSAMYRDGAGNTWGGRGPRPGWIKDALAEGQSLASFIGHEETKAGPSVAAGGETPLADRRVKAHKQSKGAAKAFKSVVKYRDDAGHAWSGRGPKPGWVTRAIDAGQTLEQLAA